jgi:hypothetical protein
MQVILRTALLRDRLALEKTSELDEAPVLDYVLKFLGIDQLGAKLCGLS